MGPCPEFRPLQMGPTEDASAEAAAPGHLPRALGLCPHWALRSRYGRGRGQPPPGGLPALASLTPADTAFSARPGRALGRRLAATHPAVTQRGHTAGPDYRARSLLLGASPHARHVRALTATRPHAHGHAHAHDRRARSRPPPTQEPGHHPRSRRPRPGPLSPRHPAGLSLVWLRVLSGKEEGGVSMFTRPPRKGHVRTRQDVSCLQGKRALAKS
ncbi:uncharacterized protein ZNF470-DT isoform X1 [Callithrix jacchus]